LNYQVLAQLILIENLKSKFYAKKITESIDRSKPLAIKKT